MIAKCSVQSNDPHLFQTLNGLRHIAETRRFKVIKSSVTLLSPYFSFSQNLNVLPSVSFVISFVWPSYLNFSFLLFISSDVSC